MGQNEETEGGSVTVTVTEQTAILEKLRVMHVQIDELTHNMERGVTMRVKNTLESNADLKLEVRNLRAELTDQRASNKVVTAERDKLHGELVNVRSALAAATEERDSLRITLDAWEQADTKPHKRVADDDVADHAVPTILHVSEPDPANDAKFRNVVPTPEMIAACQWWDVSTNAAICFKNENQRPVVWRYWGDHAQYVWKYEDCPQPLKPRGMTWQQLDKMLADKVQETKDAPVPAAERPLCTTCHGCGGLLDQAYPSAPFPVECGNMNCDRGMTEGAVEIGHPYHEPCKSDKPVRHE